MNATFRRDDRQGWGNSISWFTPPSQSEPGAPVLGKMVGWLRAKPQVDDLIVTPMKSGRNALFRVTAVKRPPLNDPPDMFFADVTLDGYEDGEDWP